MAASLAGDGTRMSASFGEISGRQDVRVFETAALSAGSTTPLARFDFDTAVPNGFVFSPDGRYLYGSSYYTGVSNIFRYDPEARKLDAVTNTETGFFRPVPLAEDRLLAFRYTGRGFLPAEAAGGRERHYVLRRTADQRAAGAEGMDARFTGESALRHGGEDDGRVRARRTAAAGVRRPDCGGIHKGTASLGAALNFSDPLLLNRLRVTTGWSPGGSLPAAERLPLSAAYERYDWRAQASLNDADFYDLFGPTKVGRKGYAALLGHRHALIYDGPRRLELDLSGRIARRSPVCRRR